jgi:hypothetical protein
MVDKVLKYGISYGELMKMNMDRFFYILHLADWRSYSEAYVSMAGRKGE